MKSPLVWKACVLLATGLLSIVVLVSCVGNAATPTNLRQTPGENPDTTPSETAIQTSTPVSEPAWNLQLTYLSKRNELYAVDIDCLGDEVLCLGEPRLLFKFPRPVLSFEWSPNGDQIAFESIGEGMEKTDVFVSDWDGGNIRNLTNSLTTEALPTWSPDGTKIAYIAHSLEDGFSVQSADLQGNTERLLANLDESLDPISLDWSPAGDKVAFSAYDLSNYGIVQIFLANLDGSSVYQLTESTTDSFGPNYSSDGSQIVFWEFTDRENLVQADIHMIQLDGYEESILVSNGKINTSSIFSPIDEIMAYLSKRDGVEDIYLFRITDSTEYHLTIGQGNVTSIAWRAFIDP